MNKDVEVTERDDADPLACVTLVSFTAFVLSSLWLWSGQFGGYSYPQVVTVTMMTGLALVISVVGLFVRDFECDLS